MRGATLAVAESCTGGMMAERLTSVSGSSRYFVGGVVAYSNQLKTKLVGVPAKLIAEYGAVSREVAIALAEGIRARTKATSESVSPESPGRQAAPRKSLWASSSSQFPTTKARR